MLSGALRAVRGPNRRQRTVRARHLFEERAALVFGVAFVATALFGVLAILARAKSSTMFHWDIEVADNVHGYFVDRPTLIHLMRALSFIGSTVSWWVIMAVVTLYLLSRRLHRLAAFVVVTTLGSSVLNGLAKAAIDRARPHFDNPIVIASGKSFPSGHAQAALVGYGVLLAVFLPLVPRAARRWALAAGILMTLLIGFSRIALGVHYVSDVLGGYLAGAAWLLGMGEAFRAWRRAEGMPVAPATEGLEPEHRDELTP